MGRLTKKLNSHKIQTTIKMPKNEVDSRYISRFIDPKDEVDILVIRLDRRRAEKMGSLSTFRTEQMSAFTKGLVRALPQIFGKLG